MTTSKPIVAAGRDLKVGDTLVWRGSSRRFTIVSFRDAAADTIAICGEGTRIASFAQSRSDMTIPPADQFELIARGAS